jgi:hypothetical protein
MQVIKNPELSTQYIVAVCLKHEVPLRDEWNSGQLTRSFTVNGVPSKARRQWNLNGYQCPVWEQGVDPGEGWCGYNYADWAIVLCGSHEEWSLWTTPRAHAETVDRARLG